MVPCAPLERSMTGVARIPIVGLTTGHPRLSEAVSPEGRTEVDHSGDPAVSASKAYTVSFSVATYKTSCGTPEIVTDGTYRGCPSTLVFTGSVNNKPKLVEFTLDGDRSVSVRFCPVRAASLCHVSTAWADRWGTQNMLTRHVSPVIDSFRAKGPLRVIRFIINPSIALRLARTTTQMSLLDLTLIPTRYWASGST